MKKLILFFLLMGGSLSAQQIIHYWHFNSVNGTVDSVAADVYAGTNTPYFYYQAAYPGVVNGGYMDDVSGDTTNAKNGEPAGNGVRPRNPSDSMEVMVSLPTTGFTDPVLTYASQRSGSGMLKQVLSYTLDGSTYVEHPDTVFVQTSWELVTFDFSSITGVDNNPNFAVKLRFYEQNVASNGNNRIDNFVLEGTAQTSLIHYWHFNTANGTIDSIAADLYAGTDAPYLYYRPSFPSVATGGFMDDVAGDVINARNNEPAGTGIRPRNPSDSMEVFVQLPTTGFANPVLSYATQRSGSGMLKQVLSYTLNGTTFIEHPDTVFVQTSWNLVTFDFSSITGAEDNADFAVKLRFYEQNVASNGNNRIDNLVLEGNSLGGAVTGVSLNTNMLTMLVSDDEQLEETVLPANAFNKTVSWTTSDATVATVNASGLVTATGIGAAYIVVETNEGGFTDTCFVDVVDPVELTVLVLGDGVALQGASVVVDGDTLITNASGEVVYSLLPTSYQMEAFATGFFPQTITSNLTNDTTVTFDLNSMNAVVHYWHFNNLPIGTVTSVEADYTLTPWARPVITYEGSTSGYMDDFSPGTILNAQFGEPAGAALRVRNRSEGRALIIPLPTNQSQDIVLSFDIHRSGQGMLNNHFEYTLDGVSYDTAGIIPTTILVTETYTTHVIDFSAVTGANNNPDFGVRITWTGNTEQDNGNNRYDNIVMSATTTLSVETFQAPQRIIYPNPSNGFISVKNMQSGVHYRIISINGSMVDSGVYNGDRISLKEGLPNGMYVLLLEDTLSVQKFLLHR